jgi:diadenosine tetraphosphate (Ap4A) HIT family hydrolase
VSEPCFICQKHLSLERYGGAIFESDHFVASHGGKLEDAEPVYLGWVVIETRRHVHELGDLNDAESRELGPLMARLAWALAQMVGAEHVYSFLMGDGVPHFHLHLFPRYPGTPREFWGTRVDEAPDVPRGGIEEVRGIVTSLQRALLSYS